jgi:hypothetical protein
VWARRISFAAHSAVILRSRALARRLEGWRRALVAYPSRLAEDGEHLRMTAVLYGHQQSWIPGSPRSLSSGRALRGPVGDAPE